PNPETRLATSASRGQTGGPNDTRRTKRAEERAVLRRPAHANRESPALASSQLASRPASATSEAPHRSPRAGRAALIPPPRCIGKAGGETRPAVSPPPVSFRLSSSPRRLPR